MMYLVKFLYNAFLLPPGLFLVLLLALGIWLYRREKIASIALLSIAILFYLFSTPLVGGVLIRSLEGRYRPPAKVSGDVVVMLGGGATSNTPDIDGLGQLTGSAANRLLTAARLSKKTGLPIIVSAGRVFQDSGEEALIARRELLGLGIPPEKITAESKSRNTEENAIEVAKMLKKSGYKKPILVTSAYHMERSVRNFSRCGVHVEAYPTDYLCNPDVTVNFNSFAPSYSGLYLTGTALREYLGIVALWF